MGEIIGGGLLRSGSGAAPALMQLDPVSAMLSGTDVIEWSDGTNTLTPVDNPAVYVPDHFGAGLPAIHVTGDRYAGNAAMRGLQRAKSFYGIIFVFDQKIAGDILFGAGNFQSGILIYFGTIFFYAANGQNSSFGFLSAAGVGATINTTCIVGLLCDFASGIFWGRFNGVDTATVAIPSATDPSEDSDFIDWCLGANATTSNANLQADCYYGDIAAVDNLTDFNQIYSDLQAKYSI